MIFLRNSPCKLLFFCFKMNKIHVSTQSFSNGKLIIDLIKKNCKDIRTQMFLSEKFFLNQISYKNSVFQVLLFTQKGQKIWLFLKASNIPKCYIVYLTQ